MTTTKKKTETKERAAVGRERKLALALTALLDSEGNDDHSDHIDPARLLLKELGYGDLISIPRRVAALNTQLKAATDATNWGEVARLGGELARAQAGLPPSKPKVAKGKNGGAGDA